ncbi:rifin PIR protein, putative [Plasmodium reichenowi]|uniref:Rifin PIR protein, putative n=1 Tax=Plasmodium reichenowi TaxID=5854 RepID=A0A2P9D4T9_PLARE|nr:rifin PIR protein, putative [Plasmodium reichenowi]
MKLYYFKILLFVLILNILLTSYHVNTHKKPSITPHHTQTNRSLCESDTQSSLCNNDADMKSVKENFHRQTSQRFEEYKERMKDKREKRKEERDKNIQKIIEKDKREKSLEEKIEKGCLKCGGVFGGGIAPGWGLLSGLGYAGWSHYIPIAVAKAATDAGIEAGLKVGLAQVREIVTGNVSFSNPPIPTIEVLQKIIEGKFTDEVTLHGIFNCISSNINGRLEAHTYELFFTNVKTMALKPLIQFNESYPTPAAEVSAAFSKAEGGVLAKGVSKTSTLTTGITASVVTIVVIVLILVIIYLILRYRRKKKMNKKSQYTKLLKE